MNILALCYTCQRRHPIQFDPKTGPGAAFGDWLEKHPSPHQIDFWWPGHTAEKSHLLADIQAMTPNADRKEEYAASASLTLTLASLATSATLVAGRESTAVSNATNKYLDELLAGEITTGTSPTAGTIEIWLYGGMNDTPDYPDVLDGTDSAETMTSVDIKRAALGHVASLITDATSNQTYPFGPASVAARFGGSLPKNWGVFVTHNTAVNLNSTAGNHFIDHTPIYETIV